ncbi:hypothetical protein CLU79DRAFT_837820 [Phycomyces nitens]|nr:hypothetical protein CLU79DRAFT_837813 [Phycomyces nitens]KAI9016286.1 hypothetical protein CLU79DRAFT_837820 [Phycomyces nitens]
MFGQILSEKASSKTSTRPIVPCKKAKSDSLTESSSFPIPTPHASDTDFDYNKLCAKDEDDDIKIIMDPSELEPEAQYLFEICKISIS